MKKFFSILVVFVLLGNASHIQAQKWRGIKKALSPQTIKNTTLCATREVESAVRRAIKNSQVSFRPALFHERSLRAFAPNRADVQLGAVIPPFPFEFHKTDREMYRGMVLDSGGEDLRYILQHGLEVSKSHYDNTASYDEQLYPSGTKAIFATHDPQSAVYYIMTDNECGQYLPVILHLKKLGKKSIVSVPHDIPPSWIYRVSALLKVDGKLQWGEVKLQDGKFVFTSYTPSCAKYK